MNAHRAPLYSQVPSPRRSESCKLPSIVKRSEVGHLRRVSIASISYVSPSRFNLTKLKCRLRAQSTPLTVTAAQPCSISPPFMLLAPRGYLHQAQPRRSQLGDCPWCGRSICRECLFHFVLPPPTKLCTTDLLASIRSYRCNSGQHRHLTATPAVIITVCEHVRSRKLP